MRLVASFLVSLVVCALVREFALRRSLVDKPNERSLHKAPVPRLGGVGIVVASLLVVTPWARGCGDLVLPAIGIPVAVLGFVDDVKPLSAPVRLFLQVLLAAIAVVCLGIPERVLFIPGFSLNLGRVVLSCAAILWLVGVVNLYNFMDGMDGLAGFQAFIAAFALSTLGMSSSTGLLCAGLAGASLGFLVHNSPPAKMFMGDGGSTFLGFVLAAIPLHESTRSEPSIPFLLGPILLGPILLDATYTLFRRAIAGHKVWEAHRTHLYQRAVATGLSHRDVLEVYVGWMLVLAFVALGALEWCRLCASQSKLAFGLACAIASGSLLVVRAWVVRLERAAAAAHT